MDEGATEIQQAVRSYTELPCTVGEQHTSNAIYNQHYHKMTRLGSVSTKATSAGTCEVDWLVTPQFHSAGRDVIRMCFLCK